MPEARAHNGQGQGGGNDFDRFEVLLSCFVGLVHVKFSSNTGTRRYLAGIFRAFVQFCGVAPPLAV